MRGRGCPIRFQIGYFAAPVPPAVPTQQCGEHGDGGAQRLGKTPWRQTNFVVFAHRQWGSDKNSDAEGAQQAADDDINASHVHGIREVRGRDGKRDAATAKLSA